MRSHAASKENPNNTDFHTQLSKYVSANYPQNNDFSSDRNMSSPTKERASDVSESGKPLKQSLHNINSSVQTSHLHFQPQSSSNFIVNNSVNSEFHANSKSSATSNYINSNSGNNHSAFLQNNFPNSGEKQINRSSNVQEEKGQNFTNFNNMNNNNNNSVQPGNTKEMGNYNNSSINAQSQINISQNSNIGHEPKVFTEGNDYFVRSSEQTNFMLSKSIQIPPLNIPAGNSDSNPAGTTGGGLAGGGAQTLTRSTRRVDPFQSFSTNSNRFSSSIDSGLKDGRLQMPKVSGNADTNLSLLENNNNNDNSYFYEDRDERLNKHTTSIDKMKDIAACLGQYNLTIDLGCMLTIKRRQQLDQVAQISCMQEVENLMELSIDQQLIQQKNQVRQMSRGNQPSIKKNEHCLNLNLENDHFTLMDSLDMREGASSKESFLVNPNQYKVTMNLLNRQRKYQLQQRNNKKHLKILLNIIYLVVQNMDPEQLQLTVSPVSIIYTYLCTESCSKNRNKQFLASLLSRRGHTDMAEFEFEVNKMTTICEGLDNVHGMNTHYQKTMMDLFQIQQKKQGQSYIDSSISEIQNKKSEISSNMSLNQSNFTSDNNVNRSNTSNQTNDGLKGFRVNGQHNPPHFNVPHVKPISKDNSHQILRQGVVISSNNFNNTSLAGPGSSNHDNSKQMKTGPPDQYTSIHNENMSIFHTNQDQENQDDDKSIDSIEELDITGKQYHIDQLLVPDNLIYFKIINCYSLLSQYTHECLTTRKGISPTSYELNSDPDDDEAEERKADIQSRANDNIVILKQKPLFPFFMIKGIVLDFDWKSIHHVQHQSNIFLSQFEKRFKWYLNNIDMNNPMFYQFQQEQLQILNSYIANNNSRILCYEIIDHTIEILIMLKRQFIQLSPLNLGGTRTGNTSVRVATPLMTYKVNSASNSKNNPQSAHYSVSTTSNQILSGDSQDNFITNFEKSSQKSYLFNNQTGNQNTGQKQPIIKINAKGSRLIIDSPNQPGSMVFNQHDQNLINQNAHSTSVEMTKQLNFVLTPLNLPFILQHKDLFGLYLNIIGRIMLKAPRNQIYKLLNQLYFKDSQWRDLTKYYMQSIFSEIMNLVEFENQSSSPGGHINQKQDDANEQVFEYFSNAYRILFYLQSIVIMCQNIIFKEQLSEKKSEKSRDWKIFIKRFFLDFQSIIRPGTGLIPQYLQANSNLNSIIITQERNKQLSNVTTLRLNLFREILQLVKMVFSFNSTFSCLLTEEIASFYIKFCFINFVKLYSHSNANELNEINNKIKNVSQKSLVNSNDLKNNLSNLFEKTNQHQNQDQEHQNKMGKYYTQLQIRMLNSYIQVLFSLSTTRTDQITRKFFHYRIVEFFTREIDLEFDVTQLHERFKRIKSQAKQQHQSQKNQQSEQSKNEPGVPVSKISMPVVKGKVPQLNLSGTSQQSVPQQNSMLKVNMNLASNNNNNNVHNPNNMNTKIPPLALPQKSEQQNNNLAGSNAPYSQQKLKDILFDSTQMTKQSTVGKPLKGTKKIVVPFLPLNSTANFNSNMEQPNVQPKISNTDGFNLNIDGQEQTDLGLSGAAGVQTHIPLNFEHQRAASTFDNMTYAGNLKQATSLQISPPQSSHLNNQQMKPIIPSLKTGNTSLFNKGSSIEEFKQDNNQGKQSNQVNNTMDIYNRSVDQAEVSNQPQKVLGPTVAIEPVIKPTNKFSLNLKSLQKGSNDNSNNHNNNISGMAKLTKLNFDNINKDHSQSHANKQGFNGSETKNLNLSMQKNHQFNSSFEQDTNSNQNNTVEMENILQQNVFYYTERKLRQIYQDSELHSNVIALLISLLLTPNRGTLDENYTSQHPINDGKSNILFLLHHHLNHPSNQHIIPLLLAKVSQIKPYPAGQRLIKLLCISLTDVSEYQDWQKIASGAYGVIYQCQTDFMDPPYVAIKMLGIPDNIYERSVLHDIFTEITCLQNFRLDPCVTDLYDYGVTNTDYVIIMKQYPISLKEWRLKQKGTWQDNLAVYLTIYKDVLKATQMLHQNNVTHYDIQADNILLDSRGPHLADNNIRVVVGDFGQCQMFRSEEDQRCMRSKGTEYIQSPEMLTLTISSKKEDDRYDRRKKVGTTRASDIWSLGCLLFEILTGQFLFYHHEWAQFYLTVTTPTETLLTEQKNSKIGNNVYVIDFLQYILVREPQIRPNIDNVLQRFQHICALLVSSTNPNSTQSADFINPIAHSLNLIPVMSFESLIDQFSELLQRTSIEPTIIQFNKNSQINIKHNPTMLQLMEEIFICTRSYFILNKDKLVALGITHVVSDVSVINPKELNHFQFLLIDITKNTNLNSYPFELSPQIMDYMREIFLYRGQVLYIQDDDIHSSESNSSHLIIRSSLIYCLTYFFKCSVYETWSLINTQILFLHLPYQIITRMSEFSVYLLQMETYLDTFPKAQCICGCTTFILQRNYNSEQKINIQLCSCSKENQSYEVSACPSDGCTEYLKFIRKRYKLNWEAIKWGFLSSNNFLVGPYNSGQITDQKQIQFILNSDGPAMNCIPYQSNFEGSDKKQNFQGKNLNWKIYQCQICHMWMYAVNPNSNIIAFIMNNLIRRNRQGIMNQNSLPNSKIKTPILRHFNLYELK